MLDGIQPVCRFPHLEARKWRSGLDIGQYFSQAVQKDLVMLRSKLLDTFVRHNELPLVLSDPRYE